MLGNFRNILIEQPVYMSFRSKNQTFMTEKRVDPEKEDKRKIVDQESSRAREKQQEQEENERKKNNAVVSLK